MTNLSELKNTKLKEFEEKFPNLQMVVGYGEENDRIDAVLIVRSFFIQAMDDIQNATIEAVQEEIKEPQKSMDIELIIALLEKAGLNPKNEQVDGFNRWIEFNTKYQKCWIEWYVNVSTLRVGDKWGTRIPFTHVSLSEFSPSNKICLVFSNNAVEKAIGKRLVDCSTQLTIEKLDWQENLSQSHSALESLKIK